MRLTLPQLKSAQYSRPKRVSHRVGAFEFSRNNRRILFFPSLRLCHGRRGKQMEFSPLLLAFSWHCFQGKLRVTARFSAEKKDDMNAHFQNFAQGARFVRCFRSITTPLQMHWADGTLMHIFDTTQIEMKETAAAAQLLISEKHFNFK